MIVFFRNLNFQVGHLNFQSIGFGLVQAIVYIVFKRCIIQDIRDDDRRIDRSAQQGIELGFGDFHRVLTGNQPLLGIG